MLIQLTGVVQNGEPYVAGVPTNNRTTLSIPRGASATVTVTVVTTGGVPFDVSLWTSVLTIKRSPEDALVYVTKGGALVPEAGPNVVAFTFAPTDTASPIFTRRAVYDIWLINEAEGKSWQIMPASPCILEPTVRSVNGPLPPPPAPVIAEAGTVPAPGGPYYTIAAGTPVAIVDGVLVAADAGEFAKMPAVGVYTGGTTNRVRTDGDQAGYTGLPENAALYVAVGGGLTDIAPSLSGQVSQRLGESIGTTAVFISPQKPIRIL